MAISPIAAQLYTVREFMKTPQDIAATLKRVKAIGYQAVQLSGLGPIDPQQLADLLVENDLKAVITHIGFNRLQDDIDAVIREHHLWQCPNVAIGALPGEYRSAEGYVTFAKMATDVARTLADANLTFSYHNHRFEFEKYGDKLGLELLYDNSDPALVLAELDTYWVQAGGADPALWVRRMANRQVVVHLKDMTIKDDAQIMAEVGEGNLNWPAILQACKESGVQWYAVEQDVCQRDPFESLAISLKNLQAMGL